MKIIKLNANKNGSRPPLQEWGKKELPKGYAWCPDEFAKVFYNSTPAGFVDIVVEDDKVIEMSANQEAFLEYIATHPAEDKPTEETHGKTIYDELAEAFMEGVNSIG